MIRIEQFMGMAPKLSDRLLPPTGSADARNCRLRSGELRGLKAPEVVHRFTDPVTYRSGFRIVDNRTDPAEHVWMGFVSNDVDVVRAPLVGDSLLRYYWTGEENYVAYNSLDRIKNGDGTYRLGTPAPVGAPSIVVTGGVGDVETRAYVYTFVNEFGEESAPSPITTTSGTLDGSWDLSSLDTAGPDMTDRNPLDVKRIYRTVTGESSSDYYFVAEIPVAQATYSDTITSAEVVLNNILQTWGWDVPPDELTGLISHPNGFMVGFVGRDLYMSPPYRPHAWPAEYILSVEQDIVGLAIYNNMIAVMTRNHPYLAPGGHPATISLDRSDSVEPCLAKRGIASTLAGVIYPSPNGLVMLNEQGATVVTGAILTIEEWESYEPENIFAAQYGETYLAFQNGRAGFKFTPSEPFGVWSVIDRFINVEDVITDHDTGQAWLMESNTFSRWEPPNGLPLYYVWKSKEFDFPRPVNLGACIVKMEGDIEDVDQELLTAAQNYNAARIAEAPLHPINWAAIGSSRRVTLSSIDNTPAQDFEDTTQNKLPVAGGPIVDVAALAGYSGELQIRVTVDGKVRYSRPVVPNTTMRMPSGFKGHVWQFELIGNVGVFSMAFAETAKGLSNV